MRDDTSEYRFLTTSDAHVECRLAKGAHGEELQILANRAGLLSLANVLLWLHANSWRREFLSLGELSYVKLDGSTVVHIRIDEDDESHHGRLGRLDRGQLLEWSIAETGLLQVALWMHNLASKPEHEYDRLFVACDSEFGIVIRLTDAEAWLV